MADDMTVSGVIGVISAIVGGSGTVIWTKYLWPMIVNANTSNSASSQGSTTATQSTQAQSPHVPDFMNTIRLEIQAHLAHFKAEIHEKFITKEAVQDLLKETKESVQAMFKDLKEDIQYIRDRLDQLNDRKP